MAANDVKNVKFIALSRLTDRKIILTLNPHKSKSQYNQEFSNEVRSNLGRILTNSVTQALKSGHWKGENDGMQGTWYSQVHSEPAQIVFSILMDADCETQQSNSLLRQIVAAVQGEARR